jgi:radical SAM protein with 4Fe4S-binding SPASM domain
MVSLSKFSHQLKDAAEKLTNRKLVASYYPPFISFHKRFLSVRMDITGRCNLKCIICTRSVAPSADDASGDIDQRLFLKIAEQIFPKASELFLSCASEPLMAKDLPRILEVVAQAGVPFAGFTSNGVLFNEGIIRKVISAGIKEIEISFDGANESTFRRIRGGASLKRVVENIKLFNDLKASVSASLPQIVLHTTLMLSNITEMSDILGIAHDLGISQVRALHLFPHDVLNIKEESLYHHKDLYDSCITAARAKADELGIDFLAPPLFGQGRNDHAAVADNFKNNRCIYPWTMIRIAPNGDVFPCATWLETEPFGNLSEQTFSEIWYGRKYQQLRDEMRRNVLPKACSHCPTKMEFAAFQ